MLINCLFQQCFDLLITLAVAYYLGSVYQESSKCIGYENCMVQESCSGYSSAHLVGKDTDVVTHESAALLSSYRLIL